MNQWILRYLRPNVLKIRTPTLNVNISRSTDPIGEISFRPDSPDQGRSNELKIIENESVDHEIFVFKYNGTDSDMK